MSQRPVSQKIERTCEGCDKKVEFELVGATEETLRQMMAWFTVIREDIDPDTGRPFKMLVQACSLECISAAAVKLLMPPSASDDIDLGGLRVGMNDPTAN